MLATYQIVQRQNWVDRAHAYKAAGFKIDPSKPPALRSGQPPATPAYTEPPPDMLPWMKGLSFGGEQHSGFRQDFG